MRRPLLLLSTLLGLAACGDASRPTGPVMGNLPRYAISDGAHGGGGPTNGDFFFLPPMVPDPSGALTYDAGAFDATQTPRVEICRLTTTEPHVCAAAPFRVFSGAQVAVSTADERYQVNWHTDEDDLDVAQLYRISVLVPRGARDGVLQYRTLGFADVDPVSTGKELRNIATGELIGLVDGRTLPIKFRIERSPSCGDSDDCVEAVIGDAGGRVETETGYAIAEFPDGWLPEAFADENVVVTIRRVAIGAAPGQEPSCHGTAHVQYEGCYDFETFPDVGTFALPATISTCIEPDALPWEEDLQLAASDDGANFRLLPPATVTIECEGFAGTAAPPGPIGFLGRISERLLAFGGRVGEALAPRKLYAVDKGRGGLIDGFSHAGWVLPVTVARITPEDEVHVTTPGAAVPVSVIVRGAHDSNQDPPGLANLTVSFAVSESGGTLSLPAATTNADGVASTTWTVGAIGQHQLTATVGVTSISITVDVVEAAPPLVLTFDTDPAGAAIPAGAVVNSTYAPLGISLRRIGSQQACPTESENVYANDHGPGGFGSGQNNVSVCPQGIASDFNEESFGRIEATFLKPASHVCIDVWPTADAGVSFMEAYDAEGVLLGRIESDPGVNETICLDQPGARSVQFSGMGSLHAIFDNLLVEF